jgi:hypothetical protein
LDLIVFLTARCVPDGDGGSVVILLMTRKLLKSLEIDRKQSSYTTSYCDVLQFLQREIDRRVKRRTLHEYRCCQLGAVIEDAELRTSAAGKPWMSVIVRSSDGDAASFVQAAIFGDAAVALDRIERNEKLYAEDSIRINEWTTAAGEKWTGLSMAAWHAERPGVGRNKPKRTMSKQTGVPPGMVGAVHKPPSL